MKKTMIAVLLVCALLLSLGGCKKEEIPDPKLDTGFPGRTNTYGFSPASPQTLSLTTEGAEAVLAVLDAQQPEYPYAELYEIEEVLRRLDFDASVTTHAHDARNAAGVLDGSHLAALVEENNRAFLETKPFGYSNVPQEYVQKLCDFIAAVVNEMALRYPDMDWQRVYCNLGNLKILYDTGMLSYAQVSANLVLSISKNNTEIVLNMQGEDGFSRVLTHEIMHILQIGCTCEQIENCTRRAGIAVYWEDFPLNTADWTWFVEGSAERNMCNLTGGDAVTYQYKMDYLCSMTMAVLLRETVDADTMETICFYDDPQRLWDAFGCETDEEIQQIVKLMITLNILQMQPDRFYEECSKRMGIDPRESDEAMNEFSYGLKPAVCISLAREFYENLTARLLEAPMAQNDLFFLLTIFEGHMNQHLGFTNESKAQINAPFLESYRQMRQALFDALDPETDLAALYASYPVTLDESTLNASLSFLPATKRDFLAERAQWQAELGGLGIIVR